MRPRMQEIQEVPAKIVGSTVFGRYPKISIEQTFNFIISDGFLVPFAGYKNVLNIDVNGKGRDIYSSANQNLIVSITGSSVYVIDPALTKTFIGTISTASGDVFIAENNDGQIAISDTVDIWIYKRLTSSFTKASINFKPGYISFQNGRFICASIGTNEWRLSDLNNGLSWPTTAPFVGELQSKPDTVQAALKFPGRGNLLFLFGKTVTEAWVDVGAVLFPYQRQNSFNIDYGCLNPLTIAENEDIIVWLAANEQSGPAIMYSTGNTIKKISTDGIDFKLSQLTNPSNSFGFLFRQDGHLIYQINFPDDNLSYILDFNTEKFFTVTNENLDAHIAKKVVFFNDKYYFVSTIDGNLYEFGTQFTDFIYSDTDIKEIPRVRILPPLRFVDQRNRVIRSLGFTLENGQPNTITNFTPPSNGAVIAAEDGTLITAENGVYITDEENLNVVPLPIASERVDLSVSRDGGVSFGSSFGQNMNPSGIRKSRFIYQRLGMANDLTSQLRFYGFGRFVVTDGVYEVYQ